MVPLGELLEKVQSWNPLATPDAPFLYIDLSAVDAKWKTITSPISLLGKEAPSRARQVIHQDDVLVSTVRPNLNSVACVPASLDGATASTGFCILRPKSSALVSRYLFHWVRSSNFINLMVRRATGASYPAVSDRIVKESLIPLPPVSEQQRIAAILDQADALRVRRSQQLGHLDALPQAIFHKMFGRSTEWSELSTLCSFHSGGTPAKEDSESWRSEVPWFSPKDIKDSSLIDSKDHVSWTCVNSGKLRLLPPRTSVIVVRGMILAHSVPVAILENGGTINQDLKALIPKAAVDPDFLTQSVISRRRWLLARVSTSAHGTKKIDSGILSEIPVPCASLSEQSEFARMVRSVEAAKIKAVAALQDADALFASLQFRAFRGEL